MLSSPQRNLVPFRMSMKMNLYWFIFRPVVRCYTKSASKLILFGPPFLSSMSSVPTPLYSTAPLVWDISMLNVKKCILILSFKMQLHSAIFNLEKPNLHWGWCVISVVFIKLDTLNALSHCLNSYYLYVSNWKSGLFFFFTNSLQNFM